MDTVAGGARTGEKRKSIAQRSQRSQRGDLGFGELPYSVTPELLQLLAPVKRSHRGHRCDTPTRPYGDTVPLPPRSAHTSGRSDNLELK